jgi:ribosomal protein L14E/L6E/L27E
MNYQKASFVVNLLKANGNRFTPEQLDAATGSERRSRSSLYWARQMGLAIEAVRDGGRAVTAYVLASGDLDAITTATPKAANVKAPKVAKAPKAPKIAKVKSAKVVTEPSVRAINKAHTAKASKVVDQSRLSDESKAAVKTKNLETMKAVSAKMHPITKQAMTKTQEEVLEEFARMELADKIDPREYMPAFLLKEAYSE